MDPLTFHYQLFNLSDAGDVGVLMNRVLGQKDDAVLSKKPKLANDVCKKVKDFINNNQNIISYEDLSALEKLQALVNKFEFRSGLSNRKLSILKKTIDASIQLAKKSDPALKSSDSSLKSLDSSLKGYEIKNDADFPGVKPHKLPAPPIPSSLAELKMVDSDIEWWIRGEPAVKFNVFQRVLETLPEGDFKEALRLAGNEKHNIPKITEKNITYPFGYMPNRAALQKMALDYYNKYDILIRETGLDDLEELLVEIETAFDDSGSGARFVGINVANNNNYSHALPLICYFGEKDSKTGVRSKEFLIADILGTSELYYNVDFILSNFAPVAVYYTSSARQVDVFSCRTGGMLLLKRALISLQGDPDGGLKGYLDKYATFKGKNEIAYLPPAFDPSEQISNKSPNVGITIDNRDKLSNQPKKRSQPRTILNLRNAHREKIDCVYAFTVTQLNITPDTIVPENVVKKQKYGNCFELEIRGSKEVNTHLLKKGGALVDRIRRELE